MKRAYPDRKKLECQCISTVAFSKNEPELLDSPIWVMLINVVALEMLKAKMPLGMYIHKILSLTGRKSDLCFKFFGPKKTCAKFEIVIVKRQ